MSRRPTLSERIRDLARDAENPEARALILQAADAQADHEAGIERPKKTGNAWISIADDATRQTDTV